MFIKKKRWQCVQHIAAAHFWKRWRKEFLQGLQTKQKWEKQTPNFTVEDILLFQQECQRNQWPMARILSIETDVYSSSSSSDNEICDGGFGNDDFDSLTEDFKLNLLNESPLSLAI